MDLNRYNKSKENIINTFKKDMSDMDYVSSMVKSIEMNFKNIKIYEYGKEKILESNKDTIHLYTNGELNLPVYNQENKEGLYVMLYNSRLYRLIYSNVCIENEVVIEKEYRESLNSLCESHEDSLGVIEYELSDSAIDDFRLMQKIQEDDKNCRDKQGVLNIHKGKYSINDYSIANCDLIPLGQCILSNYGLFEPLSYQVNYIEVLRDDEMVYLNDMVKDINLEEKYYFNKRLGLIKEYSIEKDLKSIYYHECFNATVCDNYIAFYLPVESYNSCKNIDECTCSIIDIHKQENEKELKCSEVSIECDEDKIPF